MIRLSLNEDDIVRAWTISAEVYIQRFMGMIRSNVENGALTDEFLGSRFNHREVTELFLQLTYNAMHLHSKFEYESFDVDNFLSACIPNYVQKFSREDGELKARSQMSHVIDITIESYLIDLEDFLVSQGMVGFWFEPVITIYNRSFFRIEVYDWRAYQWTLQSKEKLVEKEDDDETSPFYVGKQ